MAKFFSDPWLVALAVAGLMASWFFFVWVVGKVMEWLQVDFDLDFTEKDDDDEWWGKF